MGRIKKYIISILIMLIFLVAIVYMYLDFSHLFGLIEDSYPSSLIKRLDVFMIAVIVAISGKDRLSKKDSVLLKITFIAICCAEISFVLHNFFEGIAFFFIAQVLLILRNGQGLKQKLTVIDKTSKLKLIGCGIAILAIYILIFTFAFYPILELSPLLLAFMFYVLFMVYALALSMSLWVGMANYLLGLFPKKNSLMVCIGMICFFVSDFLVGLTILTNSDEFVYKLAYSFIWPLYMPAILLLALSGYKYNEL